MRIQQQATSFPLTRDTLRIFLPTFIAFGLVLLIACANVSNMMLARGLARQREIGIRISLGSGRARMIRQLLTESLLLAIPAALIAFGLAYEIIRAGHWLQTAILPASGVGRVFGVSKTFGAKIDLANSLPDLGVLAFLLVVALVTTILFGLVPAIQTTRSHLVEANRGEFESGYRPARLRSALLIAQSTLCALLLILAGVSMHNEMRLSSQNLGLDIRGVFSILVSNHRFLYPYRALATIAVFLGALSFLLTGTGVFGVLSYVVTQRRKEFGIHIALGAGKARVTRMVLRQSMRLAAAGSILGAFAAMGVARVMSRYVYQINLFDAVGYAAGVSLVIAVALAASWIPVRRAVNVDPARTLHCD